MPILLLLRYVLFFHIQIATITEIFLDLKIVNVFSLHHKKD